MLRQRVDNVWFLEGLMKGIYQGMAEEAHEIIGHNNEISTGCTRPKVMQVELVYGKIDYAGGQGEIGNVTAVAIVR
jgi:hypothetical protein